MKKILMCIPSLSDANGVKSFVMSYYYKFSKKEYKFDFLLVNKGVSNTSLVEQLKNDGCKIFELPTHNILNRVSITREVMNRIVKQEQYDIVHVNLIDLYAYAIIKEAKNYNIKKIIYHVHAPKRIGKLLFVSNILNNICMKLSTDLVACTSDAGLSMFGKNKFYVVENILDINKYKYDDKERIKLRKELNCEDNIVIGAVGRLVKNKNPLFTLKILKKLCLLDDRYKLLWIGDGKLYNKFIQTIKKYKLEDRVIYIKNSDKLHKLYSAMDVFMLPSLYEGLGIVYLEAQCSGLYTLASSNVPVDIKVTENVSFISLNSIQEWVEKIERIKDKVINRVAVNEQISNSKYNGDINNKLIEIYNKRI